MPDLLAYALGALALGWVACFTLGSIWNLKRGRDVLRWLREGLPALGRHTTMQWLGTSAVKLTMADAAEPFRDLEIVVAMEARDVPPLWLHGRLNGRRDTLIIRGRLRRPPAFDAEAGDPARWTGREGLSSIDRSAWTPVPLDAAGRWQGFAGDAKAADPLRQWFNRSLQRAPGLTRLSVRRAGPYHLQWHCDVPRLAAAPAAQIIELVRQIGREAAR